MYSDSMSSLTSIKQIFPNNYLVQEIQDWLSLLFLRKSISVQFCWVPSHVGISGNEQADVAAKAAAGLVRISDVKIPHTDFRKTVRIYSMDQWQQCWTNLNSNHKLKAIRPLVSPWKCYPRDRRSSIVLTRLRIGHSYFTHKYLMASGAERQVPQCTSCHVDFTIKHILVECPAFAIKRRVNFLNDKTLSDILDDDAPVERVFQFLKEIGMFYNI